MKVNRRDLLGTLACGLCAVAGVPAAAQDTGSPLRVLMPFSPGSGTDTVVRAAQPALSKAMGGRGVVIENLPGAGGITGTQRLVQSAPDGNTIAFVSVNHAVSPSVYKKLPYDSLHDITPISVVGELPYVLVLNTKRLAASNAKELQAALKAKPDQYNFGSGGNGTISQLAIEMFLREANAKAKHIPYRGVAPEMADLLAGNIDFAAFAVPAVQAHIQAGRLQPIGMMGSVRVPELPDLPTFKEQGFAGVDVSVWFAAVGPKGLPASQVKYLHNAIVTAFDMPDVKAAMARQGNLIRPTTPERAAAFLKSEQARFAQLVKDANISVD